MIYLLTFCLFLIVKHHLPVVSGANILGLMPVPSPSHHIWNSALMHRLAELGHNVTVLSVDIPKPNDKIPPSLHYIHLEEGYSMYSSDVKFDITSYIGVGPFETVLTFYDIELFAGACILKSKGLQELLNYPNDFKFDLIIHDYTLGPMLLGFIHKFNYPPLVGMSAFHNPPITIDAMSNHYFPAYIPYHSMTYSPEMDFWQRLQNTLLFIFDTAYRRLVYLPKLDSLVRPYFYEEMPYLGELSKHTSISLVNTHPSINYVEPLPPNVIEVGGMQIHDPKPLPKDLEEFINKSSQGTVLVSFGTNMKPQDFTEEQIKIIVNAMSKLPQYNFIWKFDEKYLKVKQPKNVILRKFLPQGDILAHPKIKAFVTHCGALSSQEAIWRGVPMIGVPLFSDQHRNLLQSMLAGVAVKLDFLTMTTEGLVEKIKKVVEDPQIRANVKAKAMQFKDMPMKPLDTAVWWMEYLLRNPNPYHLISSAHKLNILQANSLDCLLAIVGIIVLIIYIVIKLMLLLWRQLSKAEKISRNEKKTKGD